MALNESDTRAKLIDPAIHSCGWTEDLVSREQTAGAIEIVNGKPRQQARGKVDYVLRAKVNPGTQPVAMALIEAKAESLPPTHGLEQAKAYAACKRMNVPFVFSTNGHLFVEFDRTTGLTSKPCPLSEFPTPAALRARYEASAGFSLEDPAARPLITRYAGGEATRRYYQDAAIRAVFEKIARCARTGEPKRALLSLATGSGKTFIAVQILKRIADAGQLPVVRNIVFFKYVRSPIAFYQMVGRGTRLDPASGKLTFCVYDYIDATRLFGQAFISKISPPHKPRDGPPPPPPEPQIQVEGFEVHVTDAGRFIVTNVDGHAMPVTVEEYKERLAAKLVQEAPTLEAFRTRWITPQDRRELPGQLPDGGRSAFLVRALDEMTDYDLYDVLGELGYGLSPRTCVERAEAFGYKHAEWLKTLPPATSKTLRELAEQFAHGGTDALESPHVFEMSSVRGAGGLAALRVIGNPADVLRQTKERIFAA